ncbi:unnamed protein product [Owenia fusiformis]|uniref:Chitin-binding type-2 domain-containing protein n=1 Tax=Owenia fusiformis TaxID=6347 RepID=A0A8S4PJ79_OWEFU|nr:unnamed protein product [Owenia fusiformis]
MVKVAIVDGQKIGRPMFLSSEQTEKCALTGLIADDKSDCCHFIRCNLNVGWRMSCRDGTVFHPFWCICVHPRDYLDCQVESCSGLVQQLDPEPCPPNIDYSTQCCLEGDGKPKIYDLINRTAYRFNGERDVQVCPPGQEFLLGSCCCEGDIPEDQTDCSRWTFNRNDFLDDERGVFAKAFGVNKAGDSRNRGAPAGPEKMAVWTGAEAKFIIPRFAGMDFRKTLTLSFWVKINSNEINQTLIHNGGLGGSGASVSIEIFTIKEGNAPKMFITGGIRVCDRTEDIMMQITNTRLFQGWTFIALTACVSQAEGRNEIPIVTLYVGENFEEVAEEVAMPDLETKRLFRAANDAASVYAACEWEFNIISNADKDTFVEHIENVTFALGNSSEYISRFLTSSFRRNVRLFTERYLEFRDKPNTRTLARKNSVNQSIRTLKTHLRNFRNIVEKLCAVLEVTKNYIHDDKFADALQAESRECFVQLHVTLTKLKSRFEDEDPSQDDSEREGEYRYKVLDRRLEEAEELTANFRVKRDVFRENADPEPTIRLSKSPMLIGEGLEGNIDEIVVCDLCSDKEQIDALRENGEIPRRFAKADV